MYSEKTSRNQKGVDGEPGHVTDILHEV